MMEYIQVIFWTMRGCIALLGGIKISLRKFIIHGWSWLHSNNHQVSKKWWVLTTKRNSFYTIIPYTLIAVLICFEASQIKTIFSNFSLAWVFFITIILDDFFWHEMSKFLLHKLNWKDVFLFKIMHDHVITSVRNLRWS